MGLSSRNLFHFTKSYDVLVKILTEGLQPRYCVEYDWGDKDLIIPMICVCDIPLSEIKIHQKKYGSYGIGLKKKIAKNIGFTPVFYLSDKSKLYKMLCEYVKEMRIPAMSPWKVVREETLLYYVKRTIGTDCDREHLRMSLRPKFENEKEWRYIPEITDSVHLRWEKKGQGQDADLASLNATTENLKIKLVPDDIAYIIVAEELERDKIIKEIKEIARKEPLWRNKEELVISKILSSEQINEDF